MLRTPVAQAAAIVLISSVTIAATSLSLDVQHDFAMARTVELVRLAHAEARAKAAATGAPTRLQIFAEEGRVFASQELVRVPGRDVLVHGVAPSRAWIESDVMTICFDGGGDPLLAPGCEEHIGTIAVRTRRGGETWLTLRPDGQLIRSATTLGS
ncbi:MAG: hypothetical protein R3266_10875 [Gemmatimonadota bacterium]|nr:hypothetical protein [Gemmatimonadota bacterium]